MSSCRTAMRWQVVLRGGGNATKRILFPLLNSSIHIICKSIPFALTIWKAANYILLSAFPSKRWINVVIILIRAKLI